MTCWDRLGDHDAALSVMHGGRALTGAVELGVGREHACARLGDGSVACWGDNARGQLGVGYRRGSREALVVKALPPAVQIVAAEDYGCALAEDGSVRCWGRLFGDAFAGGDGGSWVAQPLRYGCGVRSLAPGGVSAPMQIHKSGDLYAFNLAGGLQGGWSFGLHLTGVQDATSNGTTFCARTAEGVGCWQEDYFHVAPARSAPRAAAEEVPRCPGDFDTRPAVPTFGWEPIVTARAFVFNGSLGASCEQPFVRMADGGTKACASLEGAGVALSVAQRDALLALLADRATFEGPNVRCFEPHHAFAFYGASGKPVEWLSLCFECRKLIGSAPFPAATMGGSSSPEVLSDAAVARLGALVDSLGLPR